MRTLHANLPYTSTYIQIDTHTDKQIDIHIPTDRYIQIHTCMLKCFYKYIICCSLYYNIVYGQFYKFSNFRSLLLNSEKNEMITNFFVQHALCLLATKNYLKLKSISYRIHHIIENTKFLETYSDRWIKFSQKCQVMYTIVIN